jgi:hypothetical protein
LREVVCPVLEFREKKKRTFVKVKGEKVDLFLELIYFFGKARP